MPLNPDRIRALAADTSDDAPPPISQEQADAAARLLAAVIPGGQSHPVAI